MLKIRVPLITDPAAPTAPADPDTNYRSGLNFYHLALRFNPDIRLQQGVWPHSIIDTIIYDRIMYNINKKHSCCCGTPEPGEHCCVH